MTCNTGYTGSGTATCQTNGFFNTVTCTAKICLCLNGTPTVFSGSGGTLCDHFTNDCSACNPGYTISATAASGSAQTCNANTCTASHVTNSNKATIDSITGTLNNYLNISCTNLTLYF